MKNQPWIQNGYRFLFFVTLWWVMTFSGQKLYPDTISFYRMERGDRVIGFARIFEKTLQDNRTQLNEIIFSPYDFFPNVTERELIFHPDGKKLKSYRKTINYYGNLEITEMWEENSYYCRLLDFKRIFYFDNRILFDDNVVILDENSPLLASRFVMKNISSLRVEGKTINLKYINPSSDARPHVGLLTSRQEAMVFSGNINFIAKIKHDEVKKIEFIDDGICFFPTNSIPKIDELNFNPEKIEEIKKIPTAPAYEERGSKYRHETVYFKTCDGVQLAGTFSIPPGRGPHPGFVLLPGTGPYDRSGGGLMSSISNRLLREGGAVLRFDKRGVGESDGSYANTTYNDFALDADAAINYLASRQEIDPLRMGILGHSEGALVAARIAANNKNVRGAILLASPAVRMFPDIASEQVSYFESSGGWDSESIVNTRKNLETLEESLKNGHLWFDFNGKRLCLGIMDSYYKAPDPVLIIKQLKMPVLIIHGNDDTIVPVHHAYNLYAALKESGNMKASMVIMTNSGHFFGSFVKPDISHPYRKHIQPHKELLDKIAEWVKNYYYL